MVVVDGGLATLPGKNVHCLAAGALGPCVGHQPKSLHVCNDELEALLHFRSGFEHHGSIVGEQLEPELELGSGFPVVPFASPIISTNMTACPKIFTPANPVVNPSVNTVSTTTTSSATRLQRVLLTKAQRRACFSKFTNCVSAAVSGAAKGTCSAGPLI